MADTKLDKQLREVPRSVQALIVRDLARNHRTADAIARRHHVPRELVDALKQQHGPDPQSLIRAAAELDRPAGRAPAAPPKPVGNSDGLDVIERGQCRDWALTTGRTSSAVGLLSRALVADWEAAGRPTAVPATPAVPEAAPDSPEVSGEPYCSTCSDVGSVVVDGKVVVCACAPELLDDEDDLVDAEIAPVWVDWHELFARADEMSRPPILDAWLDVLAAVERLRDALREHDYREQLVGRVRDTIHAGGLYLTVDQVRLVLDAIEAA